MSACERNVAHDSVSEASGGGLPKRRSYLCRRFRSPASEERTSARMRSIKSDVSPAARAAAARARASRAASQSYGEI